MNLTSRTLSPVVLAGSALAALLATVGLAALSQVDPRLRVPPTAAANTHFENKIRPLLAEKCFECHSDRTKTPQGGLRLDSRAALLKGGAQGAAIVPGDWEQSALRRAVTHADPAKRMPPGAALSPVEIAYLKEWVAAGAPWPETSGSKPMPSKPTKPFWAFVPPKPPALPRVRLGSWAANPLDRFILAALEAKGLTPAPPADRRTLIRRATFDLTGLPPTPDEVKAFLADKQPGAFKRVVDRLLASPAYGERWGRHWLDVARYADSNGLDENLVFPQAWRYRDYVVRAFNQDKPIDRFIREQIAGDLLEPSRDPGAEFDHIIATGYLSLGAKMLAEDDPTKQELDIIDEQVDTLGKTFLGMTIGCARCHDHKFDPLSAKDYYALAGIFKSTKTMQNFTVVASWQEVALASEAERLKLARSEADLAERRSARSKLVEQSTAALLKTANQDLEKYRLAAREVIRLQAAGLTLSPVLEKASSVLPQGARVVEAEDYIRGNVLKDRDTYGKGVGVLVNAGPLPNVAEYELEFAEAGTYQLDLRYASADDRSFRILLNGRVVAAKAASAPTGGFYPDSQKWFAVGAFTFSKGKNLLKFERDSYFPHIDKFLLVPRMGTEVPRTQEEVAAEVGLVPEFLAQAVEAAKMAGDGKLEFRAPEKPESLFPESARALVARMDQEIESINKGKPNLPKAMAVSEGKAANLNLLLRGNYLTPADECGRRFPAVLNGTQQSIIGKGSGRLELANWLTRPDNALTSRVFVNRIWRWHFGKGIVPSTDNFGALGDRPQNQPLLDWLATSFVQDGWQLKNLHRRILLSNTYQMSSRYDAKAAKADPENRLHWRHERRRLEAEAVRDSILAVSGKLDRTMGGSLLNFKDRQYVTDTSNADPVNYMSPRRSLYLPVIRSALYDVYTAFDFGDPTVMNGDRPTTTIAPQALFMMNSRVVLESTKAMAEGLLAKQDLDDAGRIRSGWETCYGRPATGVEVAKALKFVLGVETAFRNQPQDRTKNARLLAWQSLCKALVSANEFVYVE